jgi:hypothetical protein
VQEGGDQTFTISANIGYRISEVKVDGESVGVVSSYTFNNVTKPHTIEAAFTPTGGGVIPSPPTPTPTPDPETVDRDSLQALVDEILERNCKDYTNATWRSVADALQDAKAVLADENASQAQLDDAYDILYAAENDLVTIASFGNPFTDVAEDNWFYRYVMYVNANGLMTGTSSTTFAPNAAFTRAMMVQVLYNAADRPAVGFAPIFSDVQPDGWYSDAVIWAYQNKIVEGVGGGRFAPSAGITRQELATMLYRYAQWRGYDTSVSDPVITDGFTDWGEVSNWAADAMRLFVYLELMEGHAGLLRPQGAATRAECAALLQRFVCRFEFGR